MRTFQLDCAVWRSVVSADSRSQPAAGRLMKRLAAFANAAPAEEAAPKKKKAAAPKKAAKTKDG